MSHLQILLKLGPKWLTRPVYLIPRLRLDFGPAWANFTAKNAKFGVPRLILKKANELLHQTEIRLSCKHGLAAVDVPGDRRHRGEFVGLGQVPPVQIQFCAGYPLWLRRGESTGTDWFNCVSCAQGRASRDFGENEISGACATGTNEIINP
jgi:hypothetical protein